MVGNVRLYGKLRSHGFFLLRCACTCSWTLSKLLVILPSLQLLPFFVLDRWVVGSFVSFFCLLLVCFVSVVVAFFHKNDFVRRE